MNNSHKLKIHCIKNVPVFSIYVNYSLNSVFYFLRISQNFYPSKKVGLLSKAHSLNNFYQRMLKQLLSCKNFFS